MRLNVFVKVLQDQFDLLFNPELAQTIAEAMTVAQRDHVGTFTTGGVTYAVYQDWYDGCIAGDCNPATCYTDWTLLWQQT